MSSPTCAFLTGLCVGAAAMYLFDPQGGRRRRALIRDKAYSWANDAQEYAGKKARHLSNEARGLAHEARALIGAEPAHG
ncbi:MAG TPA: YtxH domain-containing protein [Gemmataceae bacterium]|nr:YtxH domain-containing protein [Gemmataceae bacterium]